MFLWLQRFWARLKVLNEVVEEDTRRMYVRGEATRYLTDKEFHDEAIRRQIALADHRQKYQPPEEGGS